MHSESSSRTFGILGRFRHSEGSDDSDMRARARPRTRDHDSLTPKGPVMPRPAESTEAPPVAGMAPTELVAWLRQYAGSDYHSSGSRNQLFQAADLIERAYLPEFLTPLVEDVPPLMYRKPPPGHVRVRVAVAVANGKRFGAWPIMGLEDSAAVVREAESELNDKCTHRCIAVVDVPPCVPVPEVPAAVEEVAP